MLNQCIYILPLLFSLYDKVTYNYQNYLFFSVCVGLYAIRIRLSMYVNIEFQCKQDDFVTGTSF